MALTTALVLAGSNGLLGYSLRGSREKMIRQNTVAHEDNYTFAATQQQVQQLISAGQLVALPGSPYYTTKGVSFAYARPEVLAFVERLGYEYASACGSPLVITSLVRPIALQPRNASPLSVHPAGMAVDLHVPDQPACRSWLVQRLVSLAGANTIDVTEEKHPRHLHVAVFPRAYEAWAARQPALPASANRPEPAKAAAGRSADLSASWGFGPSAEAVGMTLATMLLVFAGLVPLARLRGRGVGPSMQG